MKKITQTLRLIVLLIITNIESKATTIASSVLPTALSSKEKFSEFCAAVSASTGISSEWVSNFFRLLVHQKYSELISRLIPTLTVARLDEIRNLLIQNGIFDVKNAEAPEMTLKQMTTVGRAILCHVASVDKHFTAELSKQAPSIAKKAEVKLSKVVFFKENLETFAKSPVFSAETVLAPTAS